MAELKEARVPDIGGYDGVPVIEVLVAVGDTVKADQGLITLESDKATMEVPAPFDGVVREIKVKVGDEIAEGAVVAMIEPAGGEASDEATQKPADAEPEADADASKQTGSKQAGSKQAGQERAEPEQAKDRVASSETGTKVPPIIALTVTACGGTPDSGAAHCRVSWRRPSLFISSALSCTRMSSPLLITPMRSAISSASSM